MGYKMGELRNNSLYDRVNKLLVSYEWSDCTFSVCDKKFKAHKLILGISSPVFEAMFYGPLSTNNDIVITDIEPDIFQQLLNYIYTDKVDITSIEEAFELLYVSKKYLLENLSEICISYVQSNLNIDNVVAILNYPDYMQDKQLLSLSVQLFCEHASYLLQENKKAISSFCLQKILANDDMNISEKDLIMFTFEWTTYYCEINNVPADLNNRREILIKNGLLKLLRFLTLTVQDIDYIVENKNNLLFNEESENIKWILKQTYDQSTISHIICDSAIQETIGISTVPRKSLTLQWHLCHRSPVRSATPITINSNNNFIQCKFKANNSLFINYLNIPSRMMSVVNYCNNAPKHYYEHIIITLLSEEDNSSITCYEYKGNVEYDSNIDILFNSPSFLRKDSWYKICFHWPKTDTFYSHSYGVQCRDTTYVSNKVYLEFQDIHPSSDNYGSFLRGLKFCL